MDSKEAISRLLDSSSKFTGEYWRKVYSEERFPEEYWNSISSSGLIGFIVPREAGGLGLGLSDFCSAVETTARWYAGAASYLFLSSCLSALIIERLGSETVKNFLLPDMLSGRKRLCIALTEEVSGLDSASIQTIASKGQGSFVINGSKMFVSNLDKCDYVVIFAKMEEGITAFLAETSNKAIKKRKIEKIGLEFINLFAVDIESLEVSHEFILGKQGEALKQMRDIFMMDRLATAASLIGTGWLSIDTASKYAKERVSFGRKIGSNQGVQFPLADSACRLMAAESILMKACEYFEIDRSLVNIALLQSQDASSASTDVALQTLGGHGYLVEKDVGRYWKDVRAYRLHPISEEILLASIAWQSLGLPRTY